MRGRPLTGKPLSDPRKATTTMGIENHPVMGAVRAALGRSKTPDRIEAPPELPEHLVRLVYTDHGLAELFAARARDNKMKVTVCSPEEAGGVVAKKARELGIGSAVLPKSEFLDRLGVPGALSAAGVEVKRWEETSLDAVYDVDAGVTDVWAAVAETGSLAVRASPGHGRSLSLVPEYHIAVVEPRNILPDLVDYFEKLGKENDASATVLITGPSKTADIEMNLVVGVHGPGHVEVVLVR